MYLQRLIKIFTNNNKKTRTKKFFFFFELFELLFCFSKAAQVEKCFGTIGKCCVLELTNLVSISHTSFKMF